VRKTGKTRIEFIISFGLFLIVLLVYHSITGFSFNNYDDLPYIVENATVQKGLTFSGIYWAFTSFSASNWHPVTWLSHMLDCSLFGMNPGGHYWTNLLLHGFNSMLLFIILLKLTGAVWRSAFVAALFAVHPLHVESVAWISERKDLLSAFFAFLTIWAYCSYVKSSRKRFYWGAVCLFALGLMAKPMLVTIPCVLILLDYWPLGRLRLRPDAAQFRAQLREKLPFFALSFISSLITIFAQQKAMYSINDYALPDRLSNAVISYLRYLGKAFWPADLSFFYPFPGFIDAGAVVISLIALCGLTLIAVRAAKAAPYLSVGWFWYLGTLVPVIGIVQVGSQSMADRYTYIPLIGIFIVIVWGAEALSRAFFKYGKAVTVSAGAFIVLLLAADSNVQASYWKSSKALYSHALDVTSENFVAHNNLGVVFVKERDYAQAEFHFREAVKYSPEYASAIYNLAVIYDIQNKLDEAISTYKMFLKTERDAGPMLAANAHMKLAMALLKRGNLDEAESVINGLLTSQPDNAMAHNHYGIILSHQGRLVEAGAQFEKALSLDAGNRNFMKNVEKIRSSLKAAELQ
jgi:tetratricopeptide (TPR) repeat protein